MHIKFSWNHVGIVLLAAVIVVVIVKNILP
jgi:hypothetical protein